MTSSHSTKGNKVQLKGALLYLMFFIHVIIYILVCTLLFIINLLTTMLIPPWFLFPSIGWGFGLFIHGFITYMLITTIGGNFFNLTKWYINFYIPESLSIDLIIFIEKFLLY
jgi:hypothetical protein